MRRLFILSILAFILLAGCTEKPWSEMPVDEKAKAYSQKTPEEKEALWSAMTLEEKKVFIEKVSPDDKKFIQKMQWEKSMENGTHQMQDKKITPF